MIRIFISVAVWIGLGSLLIAVWNNSADLGYARWPILAFIAFFLVIWTWATIRTISFYFARRTALQTAPVPVQITVTATSQRRGPDSLVAEVTVGEDLWRATLAGFGNDREWSEKSGDGQAWLHPKTGAPLAFEIEGKALSPIPEVIKVRPDSLLERAVQATRQNHS